MILIHLYLYFLLHIFCTTQLVCPLSDLTALSPVSVRFVRRPSAGVVGDADSSGALQWLTPGPNSIHLEQDRLFTVPAGRYPRHCLPSINPPPKRQLFLNTSAADVGDATPICSRKKATLTAGPGCGPGQPRDRRYSARESGVHGAEHTSMVFHRVFVCTDASESRRACSFLRRCLHLAESRESER